MKEVHDNIFVGGENDYENNVKHQDGWAVVHACKIPYHKEALGYSTGGAPKGHHEYYIARRGNRLIMNIIDTDLPKYFNKEKMIDIALDFIQEQYEKGLNILIHCNKGESRGPSIALLFLATRLRVIPNSSFDEAKKEFMNKYPNYNPKMGILEHMRNKWDEYCKESCL